MDSAGICLAKPLSWRVITAKDSLAVAININFLIRAKLTELDEWEDWERFEDQYHTYGSFFIIGRDGALNETNITQLSLSLGWDGDLLSVNHPVPDVTVQISVKEEEFDGKVRYRAAWINPGDYSPGIQGASQEEISVLVTQYGPSLRAVAQHVQQKHGTKSTLQIPNMKIQKDGMSINDETFYKNLSSAKFMNIQRLMSTWSIQKPSEIPLNQRKQFLAELAEMT